MEYGGLVLPDHDLTPAEFKELARRIGRAAFVPLFLKFYERIVTGEASIEEQRRALADIGRWTGVEEDRKTDPNANLPVFNFVFGVGGRMDAQLVQAAAPVLDAEELQIISDFTAAASPTAPLSTEVPHETTHPDPEQAPAAGGVAPAPVEAQVSDGPRRRRRARHHAGERSEPVPAAASQAAGTPDLPHGAPVERQAPQVSPEPVGFDAALADLDRVLGL